MLGGDRPNFKREAPSLGEMATLGEARESIKMMELITQTTMPIIYLSEILIVREINKTIGPGKIQSRKKRRVPPNIKRPGM